VKSLVAVSKKSGRGQGKIREPTVSNRRGTYLPRKRVGTYPVRGRGESILKSHASDFSSHVIINHQESGVHDGHVMKVAMPKVILGDII